MSAAEALAFVIDLLKIILASPNPAAAMQRAKIAAETEAMNVAADAALQKL